jgi:hypothetical protein
VANRLVPERLVNFRVYAGVGAKEFIGFSDIELPKFEAMTESISGAGIAGEMESVVIGHFKSMESKLKFLAVTAEAIGLIVPVMQQFTIRGSLQVQDPAAGVSTTKAVRIDLRGPVKGLDPGKFEPGKRMDTEVTVEVAAVSIFYDFVEIIALDKFNMIFRVNGNDYLRSVRQDMGGA